MTEQGNKFPGGLKVLSEEDLARADEIAGKVAKVLEAYVGPDGKLSGDTYGSMMIAMAVLTAWLIDTGFSSNQAMKVHALNLFTKSVVEKLGIEFVPQPNEVKPT